MKLLTASLVSTCLLLPLPLTAHAQQGAAPIPGGDAFPSRPIRIVVTNSPGGNPDILMRTLAPKMTDDLGKSVVVENRPGGSGIIATEYVAKSPADGYTLLVGDPGPLAINPWIFSKLPYQALKSFDSVSALVVLPYVLVVRKDLPAATLQDFVKAAKARPAQVSYGSSGTASIHHLFMEILSTSADIKLLHIPYKGASEVAASLLAGSIDAGIIGLSASLDPIKTGRMRALGFSRPRRAAVLPDVPTIAEQGFPGFDISVALGLLTPAGTPRAAINRLNASVVKAMRERDVVDRLTGLGMEIAASTPEQYDEIMKADYERYRRAVQAANLKMD